MKPVGKLGTWSFALVAIAAVGSVLSTVVQIASRDTARDFIDGVIDEDEYFRQSLPYQGITIVLAFFSMAAAIVTVVWLYRLISNHQAVQRVGTWGPLWAVFSWILPPLIYIIPFLMLRDAWKASDPQIPFGGDWKRSSDNPLLVVWFVLYSVLPLMISLYAAGDLFSSFSSDPETAAEVVLDTSWYTYASPALSIGAAVVWIMFGRQLNQRHRHLIGEPAR